jgi:hypothetical protein
MTELEISGLLNYLAAPFEKTISRELVKVWHRQFEHVKIASAMAAADFCLSRNSFGFPKPADFHAALREVMCSNSHVMPWGEAWDAWVLIARRFGTYERGAALDAFNAVSPVGRQAIGTLSDEYFVSEMDAIPNLRANFRMRYEDLQETLNRESTLSPKLLSERDDLRITNNPQMIAPGPARDLITNLVNRHTKAA